MKELSIEEKAKTYDGNYKAYTELINRLENVKDAIKKQNYGIAMDILFKPYPEFQITTHSKLVESEDERMRNVAINACKYMIDNFENSTKQYEDAIAYLEKQGEQKSEEEVDNLHNYLYGEQNPADVRTTGYWHVEDIKQEWSNEDEQYITDTLNLLSFGCSYHSVGEVVEFLKSIKDRVRVQSQWKPSNEQMRVLDLAIRCGINRGTTEETTLVSLFNDLKKLKE